MSPLLTSLKVLEYLAGGSCLDLVSGVIAQGLVRKSGTDSCKSYMCGAPVCSAAWLSPIPPG